MDPRSVPVSQGTVVVAGRYELLSLLSRGGMGEVFAARDRASGNTVALKRVRAEHTKRQQILAHFTAEYHTLARLKHPRIIEVYEFGVHADVPFYTMELLDGEDLREIGCVPYREACRYLRDVASSLALLHAQRLLHRDLSPRNIRRTADGRCKLFDFGTMTPFGVPRDVAGTAPYVPPEAAECGMLDQRADLFSLGALAYWMLTGRHAYPAQKLDDLPALWPLPVERVRAFEPSVPESLDILVMSLLALDPVKRPFNAAEVIERLNAIAQLESDGSAEVAQGYISSSKLCGRHEATSRLRGLVERNHGAHGAALLIEGAAGVGKSRLLNELAVLAQTRGLLTLRAFASNEHGSQSLVQQLRRALVRALPSDSEQADLLASQPELKLPSARGQNPNLLGFELRAKEQARLNELFVQVARERPLLIVVDDLDRADEFSASLLAGLAYQARELPLFVVASVGADREPLARTALTAFESRADSLQIAPLDSTALRELVSNMVGDVPNLERLIDWLERGARGNPGLTIELIQLLVRRGLVRYVDGTWVLPDAEIRERIPRDLADTLTSRLEPLSDAARELADIVAVLGRDAALELCLLVSRTSHQQTMATLNELMAEGIFVGLRGGYAFAQEALRDAVLQHLDEPRARSIRKALGKALLSLPATLERRLEAGIHLVQSDDELRGAELIAEASASLIREGRAWGAAIPAMESALEVFERRGAPLRKSLALRQQLVLCGYLFDYRLGLKYGEETVRQIADLAGFPLFLRFVRLFGNRLGLWLAVVCAVLRQPFGALTRSAPNIYTLLVLFGRSVMGLMGVRATSLDRAGAQRLVELVKPFGMLSYSGLQSVNLACQAFALQPQGREAELATAVQTALAALERPGIGMSEVDRVDLKVGLLLAGGINECYRMGSQALARADELEKLGTRLAQASAHRLRMTYYLVRGDRDRTEHHRKQIELHGIQGGTTWQVEWFAVPIEGMASTRYGDLVGARRALTRLRELASELPSLEPLRDMVSIGYLARRGELQAAIEQGERFLAQYPPHSVIGWGNAYADLAGAYNGLQQYARAREICELGLSALSEADQEYMIMYGPLDLERSVAMVGLGEIEAAYDLESRWKKKLEETNELGALVMLHEKRVVAAVLAQDQDELKLSLRALSESAEQTECSSLIAHAAHVTQQYEGRSQSFRLDPDTAQNEMGTEETTVDGPRRQSSPVQRLLSELRKMMEADAAHVYEDDSGMPSAMAGKGGELPAQILDVVDKVMRLRPGSGIVPVGAHSQTSEEVRTLATRGFLLKPVQVGSRVAVVVIAHPEAPWGYDSVLEEIGMLLAQRELETHHSARG
ncbi:MAG: AAA family ATPase [Myxococcales bacterium]